jgi:DNA helicase-2/ATP-dependent DNA helicase PcrA
LVKYIDVDEFLVGLNDEQKRAVTTLDGPLLILAGAGSGKTKTLTHRMAYLISSGKAEDNNILAVTFTNKAAKEMRIRLCQLLGRDEHDRLFMPFLGTFHSICVKILRIDGLAVGISRNFIIFDDSDQLSAIRQAIKQLRIDDKTITPRAISEVISTNKNELIGPDEFRGFAKETISKAAASIFPIYEQILKSANALDFDDLIGKTVELLSNNSQIREKWGRQFKYTMIDEYQDTNLAQYRLVKLLTSVNQNIAVVGDDWQSIYSWRGADYKNILNFERDFNNSAVIKLEQNYRSTEAILEAAHSVIEKNKHRSKKKLWTADKGGKPVHIIHLANERAEAEAIVNRIQTAVDARVWRFSDFAVLYRTNAQSRAIEDVFVRYNVPYRIVGGPRFYDRKEIKDLMAYLRLIFQSEDRISFSRVINVPSRKLGTKSLQDFYAWVETNNFRLDYGLSKIAEHPSLKPKAKQAFSDFYDILINYRELLNEIPLSNLLDSLIRRLDYLNYLDDGTLQGESRTENVKELLSVTKDYQDLGLEGFLEEVSLVSDIDNRDTSNDAVTLMTLHAAKGLEFPIVFMAGMEESIFPHSRSLYSQFEMEEERRLCYVGMTRAKTELYLSYASSRLLYGGQQHNPPSRFLKDIKAEVEVDNLSNAQLWQMSIEDKIQKPIDNKETIYIPELYEGDMIRHKIFGEGRVVEVEGDNLVIYFKNHGSKKINLNFAPIEKL